MTRQRGRYLELLDLALDSAERRELAAAITLVGIPPDLCYLFDGLKRTEQILQDNRAEFDQLLEAVASEETTDDWLARIQLAAQRASGLVEGDDDPLLKKMEREKEDEERHPLDHYCLGSCPHWALLFYEAPPQRDQTHWAIFRNLQAKVSLYILAAHALTRAEDFLESYPKDNGHSPEGSGPDGSGPESNLPVGRISAASRSCRRLSRRAMAPYIELFEGDPGTLSDLCDKAAKSLSSRGGPGDGLAKDHHKLLWVILGDLRRLDELVLGDPRKGGRRAISFRAAKRHEWPDGYIRLTHGQFAIGVEQPGDGHTVLHLFRDPGGRAPRDADGPEPGPPRVDCADQIGISIIEHDGDAPELGGPRRLRSERQARLTTRRSSLPNLDRASLNRWQSAQVLHGLTKISSPKLRSFLIFQLAIGGHRADSDIPILPGMPKELPKIAFVLGARPSWLLRIAPPAWAKTPWTSVERQSPGFISLPDVLGFAKCLPYPPPPVMTWDADTQRGALEWLRLRLLDSSVNLDVLRGFLLRRLLEESGGDLGLAYFLAGAEMAHSVSAAHYTAWSDTEAIEIYRRALGAGRRGKPAAYPGDPNRVIGARRVPTLEGVRNLVLALAKLVKESTGYARRNALSAYTLLGFNIATAGRAFETRLIKDVVRSQDLLVLAEKGGAYHNRVVSLPPRLQRQLDVYINALASWGYGTDGQHGLFCWWGTGTKPEGPLSPRRFDELAHPLGFDLELYSLRRFARSELLERNVAPEDIDALMGHWFHLLSPHDMLSTYPVQRLRDLAKGPINSLLADVGFETVS